MRIALKEAQAAAERGETPVGAVVVDPVTGEIVARAGNGPIVGHDPTAHAEILALRAAAARLSNYRLTGLTLVVTLEPCAMCAGAIAAFRVKKLVFGAYDPKTGAVEHGPRVFAHATTHHKPEVIGGVRDSECAALLAQFFTDLRNA